MKRAGEQTKKSVLLEAALKVSPEDLERDLPLLAEEWGGFGFVEEGGEVRAIFYLSPGDRERFREDCRRYGWEEISFREIPEEDWSRTWRESFKPLRVSSRIWVCPPWERVETDPGEVEIIIDPGQAFGTGHHPTTALMLEALDRLFREETPGRVLDLGCGTGILAIAAAKLGAERVVALDIDPRACQAARENIQRNGVKVEVISGRIEEIQADFELILANISAWELRALAPVLKERLCPGGRLFLSGFLAKEIAEMLEAYRDLDLISRQVRDEWGFLAFRK